MNECIVYVIFTLLLIIVLCCAPVLVEYFSKRWKKKTPPISKLSDYDPPMHWNCRSKMTPTFKKKWREKRMNFRNGDRVLYESNFGYVKATVVGFKNDTDVLIQLKNPQDIVKLVHWRTCCKLKRVVK